MRKFLSSTITILLLALYSGSSFAESQYDGNHFLSACKLVTEGDYENLKAVDMLEMGQCLGLVFGARDLIDFLVHDVKNGICIPTEVTHAQMARVFVKFMEEHPEYLHERAPILFYMAALDAYPCN